MPSPLVTPGRLSVGLLLCLVGLAPIGAVEPVSFVEFRYQLGGAFEFCSQPGDIYRAGIRVEEAGGVTRWVFEHSVLAPGTRGVDDCLPRSSDAAPCFIEVEQQRRTLTDVGIERVVAAFTAAIEARVEEQDPLCPLFDPCEIRSFRWDDLEITDDLCKAPHFTHETSLGLVALLDELRGGQPVPPPIRNGDVNADGAIDISDATFMLGWLFLGGPEPARAFCDDILCAGDLIERRNGDVNGDGSRDIADAVYVLNWLFTGGPEPAPLCECVGDPCADCPPPHRCVPDGIDSLVCTSALETCEDVRAVYDLITRDLGRLCDGEECHVVLGDCGIGLGDCYYAVSTRIRQEDLAALARRFGELRCVGPVCFCAPPPDEAVCRGGGCEFVTE